MLTRTALGLTLVLIRRVCRIGYRKAMADNLKTKKHRGKRTAPIQTHRTKNLETLSEKERERRYIEGYRRKPEDPAWGEAGAKMAAEVWPKEDWSEKGIRRGRAAPPRNRKMRRPRTTL